MKCIIQISLLLTFFFSSVAVGQSIEGIATYKTQRKMSIDLDSSHVDDAMKEQLMAMMRKQFEKEYTLEFTGSESKYMEVPKLDAPSGAAIGGAQVMVQVVGSGDSDVLYKNIAQNRYVNQNEMFSKQFLIKDAIETREWKLEKETKNIGEYACFKATYTYERPKMVMRTRTNGEESKEEEEPAEPEMESITVTAWYTPQIPVKNGPAQYDGLPGLILELNDAELTILCSKVVLNPKDGLSIVEPKGGKIVTQEEYDAIMEKKMKEMEAQYERDGRRGGDGNSIEIRIGG